MPLTTAPPMSRRPLEHSAIVAAWLVLAIGSIALFGWVARLPSLTRLLPEWSSMRVSTAVSFILSGAALVELLGPSSSRLRARIACAFALSVAAAGLWSLGEQLLGSPPWLETWLVELLGHSSLSAGRTSPVTSFC